MIATQIDKILKDYSVDEKYMLLKWAISEAKIIAQLEGDRKGMSKDERKKILAFKHLFERHGDLTIIAVSQNPPNGYLYYYWCVCKCGNIKRYRYDQLKKVGNCGLCDDFLKSKIFFLEELKNVEKQNEN